MLKRCCNCTVQCLCRPRHTVLTPVRTKDPRNSFCASKVSWEKFAMRCKHFVEYTLVFLCVYDCRRLNGLKAILVVYVCLNAEQNEKPGLGGSAVICNGNPLTRDARSFISHLSRWSTCQPCQCCEERELSSYNVTKQV